MVKCERLDNENSFETTFRVKIDENSFQEFHVPIWIADLVEKQMKKVTWDSEKSRKGKKTVVED